MKRNKPVTLTDFIRAVKKVSDERKLSSPGRPRCSIGGMTIGNTEPWSIPILDHTWIDSMCETIGEVRR